MKREILNLCGLVCIALLMAPPLAFSAQEKEKVKPRIFISDSQSWELAGGFSSNQDTASGSIRAGARPQTAEIVKTFGEKCPDSIVTMKSEKADYIVLLEHEGAKHVLLKDNKFAVFNKDGDAIKSGSTRSLGNAVKESCEALMKDWGANTPKPGEQKSK